MRTATDALRSVNRHVAMAFGDAWEVRLSQQKGDFYRPFVRVTQMPTLTMNAESAVNIRLTSAYQVVAFPSSQSTVDDSQANALAAVDTMYQAFTGPGVGKGRVYRVPLYDYTGIPYVGPEAFATENDRVYCDYLKVEGPPDITLNQDDDDDYLWSIAANIRMSWLRSAAVPSTGRTIVRVDAEAQVNG